MSIFQILLQRKTTAEQQRTVAVAIHSQRSENGCTFAIMWSPMVSEIWERRRGR